MPGFDFAALVEEKETYPITLSYKRGEDGKLLQDEDGKHIPDEQIILPPVLPAKLMLRFFNKDRKELQRMADSPADQLQVGMQVIEELVGKEKWDHVLETIGFDNINPLLTDIFSYYGMGNDSEAPGEGDDEGEGKAEEGNESQSITSSTTSEPSTPISNGSTPEPTKVSTISPSGGEPSSPESHTYQPKASS